MPFILQVDSITDETALKQEAYILFYVRQGKFPWFCSLLESKDALHAENTRGASPVSVLENIDANCSTSGGGSSSNSGDKLQKNEARQLEESEKDETSQYKASFCPEEPSKRSSLGASNINNTRDEISPSRPSLQPDAIRCPRSVETTNLDRPCTPLRSKRSFSQNEFGVFEFEDFGKDAFVTIAVMKFLFYFCKPSILFSLIKFQHQFILLLHYDSLTNGLLDNVILITSPFKARNQICSVVLVILNTTYFSLLLIALRVIKHCSFTF